MIAGWLLDVPILTSIVPGQIAMKFNTAVVFLMFGAGAVLLGAPATSPLRRWGYGLLAAGAAASAVIGMQYVVGGDFGIDQLFVREAPGATGTVHLGRMSPQTVASLIAISAAAFLARLRRFATPAVLATAGIAFVLGAMNLLDFVYRAEVPTFLREYTQMAVPTAALITALAVAVVELLPTGGPITRIERAQSSAQALRPMLAAAVVVPIVVGWLRLEGERHGLYGTAFGVGVMSLTTICLLLLATWLVAGQLRRADEVREAAEQRLERALADANDLYEHAPVGYHSLDAEGAFVRINETELSWLGYRREDLVGRMRFTDLLTPAGIETFAARFPEFRRRGWIRDVEFDMVRADGSLMPVAVSATAVTDADGKFVMSRSTVSDITDRRIVEEERERAREEAEAANRAKSEFLSRMSHELRTPLNSVLGFAQLLEMDDLDAEQRDSVRHITRAGRHLLELINEVLDISRIESGTMTISLESVRIGDVVHEVATLISPLAQERGLTLQTEVDSPDTHVLADRQRLRQVLLNLLSNAVKYNVDGGSVRLTCSPGDSDRVRIDVTDSGPGIGKEQMERLFTPFDRLGAERTDVEGTGMGLALARALMEMMRGTIAVQSEVGSGTTFSIELVSAEAPLAMYDPAADAEQGQDDGDTPQRTVLYIEDNLANLRLVERLVERLPNVRLLSAMQGRLGLDLAVQHRPDLILLDLHLADMNGLDVLRELRAHPETDGCEVVILTADQASWRVRQLVEEGALAYLTKPLDVPKLMDILNVALGVNERTHAS